MDVVELLAHLAPGFRHLGLRRVVPELDEHQRLAGARGRLDDIDVGRLLQFLFDPVGDLQHRVVDREPEPGALSDLVHAGKIRYVGVSEAAPETLRAAHRIYPVAALQSELYRGRSDAPAASSYDENPLRAIRHIDPIAFREVS